MVSKSDIVNNVPTVGGLCLPKGFPHVVKNVIDGRIRVVDQNVQLSILLSFDCLKKLLNLVFFTMVNCKMEIIGTRRVNMWLNQIEISKHQHLFD